MPDPTGGVPSRADGPPRKAVPARVAKPAGRPTAPPPPTGKDAPAARRQAPVAREVKPGEGPSSSASGPAGPPRRAATPRQPAAASPPVGADARAARRQAAVPPVPPDRPARRAAPPPPPDSPTRQTRVVRAAGPQPGDVVGGRYRLTAVVASGRTTLWQAEDEVLARRVAVRILAPDAGGAVRSAFVHAAATAGQVTGTGVASVYDAATEPLTGPTRGEDDPSPPVTYVVAEWVDGTPLDARIRQAPLPPAEAVGLVSSLCASLEAAHRQGVYARRLHPGQVLLSRTSGPPKLTDLEIAAAAHGGGADDASTRSDSVRADTEDLARVLYACVTGYWPASGDLRGDAATAGDPWTGLPAAPLQDGRLCLPRQVRAGLPRGLDLVVARTLEPQRRPSDPQVTTPRELREALAAGAGVTAVTPTASATPAADEPPPPRKRRFKRRWLVLPVVIWLVALGVAGWAVGQVLGRVPNPTTGNSTTLKPSASASASAQPGSQPIDLTAASVSIKSFDPEGDGSENEQAVPYATDDDPTTSWTTEQYNSATFGGLKTGVGLLIDLGKPTAVTKVTLTGPAGETVELLAADPALKTAPTTPAQTPAVTQAVTTDGKTSTLTPTSPTTSRFYVVWLTQLPELASSKGQFEGQISELDFFG